MLTTVPPTHTPVDSLGPFDVSWNLFQREKVFSVYEQSLPSKLVLYFYLPTWAFLTANASMSRGLLQKAKVRQMLEIWGGKDTPLPSLSPSLPASRTRPPPPTP